MLEVSVHCYAATFGDCSGGPSAEHYISKSVLRIAGSAVRVSGFPWQAEGARQDIGIGSLGAKILCRGHNEQLSSLDETGERFVRALKTSFDHAVERPAFSHDTTTIDGDRLERWLLKVLCGLLTVVKRYSIPSLWLEILFRDKAFPENHGLHFFGKSGKASWMFNLLRVICVPTKQGGIAGAKFGIAGIPILLAFGEPDFGDADFSSYFRPDSIEISKGSSTKRMDFKWHGNKGGGTVTLRVEGPIDPDAELPLPMVRPY
jgi:hypothetical protein